MAEGLLPSAIELLDPHTVEAVSAFLEGLPKGATLLLLEFDGTAFDAKLRLRKAKSICIEEGASEVKIAETKEESDQLWKARKAISPALSALKPNRFAEDVVIPVSELETFLAKLELISSKHGITISTYGHAGDGNLHPSVLFDERDPDEVRRAQLAVEELVKTALELGGSISGEHGIGLSKVKYFGWEHEATEIKLMKAIKRVLDPNNILNPGKIFE
jgi:glycolate oxidase